MKASKRPIEDIDPKAMNVPQSKRKRRERTKPEPSKELVAGKASARARALKRPLSPGVMFEPRGDSGHHITSPHSDLELWELQIADAFGTRSTSIIRTFLDHLRRLVPQVWDEGAQRTKPHETELNAALAMVSDFRPCNVTEAALAAQMVAVHWLTMKVAAHAIKYEHDTRTAVAAGKLARTFTLQIETLQSMRGKKRTAHQSITVRKDLHQHVHYHRGEGKSDEQPHERRAKIVDQCTALPSPEPGEESVQVPGDERQGAMPDARRR